MWSIGQKLCFSKWRPCPTIFADETPRPHQENWFLQAAFFPADQSDQRQFMKTYQPADLRNFAIVGHASSGKTMLAEAMLMCGGVINRMGRIADGSTVSDYHVSEKNRNISVSASLLHTEWMGKKFNLID